MGPAFDKVILVDRNDNPLGVMDKLEAHQKGLLHRAFSIFLFNEAGEMLLQKRASTKYHCGGLWSNTCCSHPIPNYDIDRCLSEKLFQEMGIGASLQKAFDFTYRAQLDNGLTEYEYDHVYIGHYSGTPQPNPNEVDTWCYASLAEVSEQLARYPEHFTPWFRLLFPKLRNHFVLLNRA